MRKEFCAIENRSTKAYTTIILFCSNPFVPTDLILNHTISLIFIKTYFCEIVF